MNVTASASPPALPAATGTSGTASTSGTTNGKPGQQIDYMKLIVAQMQNMNPMDPSSGGNGLATMMQAEELNLLSQLNTAFTSLQTLSQTGYASSLIGRQVSGVDGSGAPLSGVVTGVKVDPNGPLLSIGDKTVRLLDVTSIDAAATPPGQAN
jgi:flagellar basal-body rod modification protein FlgD